MISPGLFEWARFTCLTNACCNAKHGKMKDTMHQWYHYFKRTRRQQLHFT